MRRDILVVITLFFSFIIWSCSNKKTNLESSIPIVDTSTIPTDSNTLYFPEKSFLIDTGVSSIRSAIFINSWYSKMLFALHEPVLYNYQDTADIFRFTWLRTRNNPISIRVRPRYEKYILTLKILNGTSGNEAGKLVTDTSFLITKDQWNEFVNKTDQIDFWKLNSVVNDEGKDGAEWILEGRRKGQYHFVNRWYPEGMRDKEFRECCGLLMKIAKLNLASHEIY